MTKPAEYMTKPNESSLSTLDSRLRKLEDAAAWLNEPSPDVGNGVAESLAEMRTVLLFIATQPWPRDKDTVTDWASLVAHIKDEQAKVAPKTFRESAQAAQVRAQVIAEMQQQMQANPPTVRDVL